MRRRFLHRSMLALVSFSLAMFLAEGFLRVTNLDWTAIRHQAPGTITRDINPYQPSSDPVLVQVPRPGGGTGQGEYGPFSFSHNSLGFRDPERSAEKEPHVLRIMVFGGSNVWGMGVDDSDTWPARLEAHLNEGGGQRVEVWNGGVSAYNPWQACHRARLSLPLHQPDLVIIGISNTDLPRHLHPDLEDLAPYYVGDSRFWDELFPPGARPTLLPAWDRGGHWLLDHCALFRAWMAVRLALFKRIPPREAGHVPHPSPEPAQACLQQLAKEVPSLAVIVPAVPPRNAEPFLQGTGQQVYNMQEMGLSTDQMKIHPPPWVLDGYALKLTAALRDRRLVR